MKVRDVMTSTVVTASPGTPLPELIDRMLRYGVDGLPIVDERGEVVGIVTEADLVSKEAYGGRHRGLLELLADLVAGGESDWVFKAKAHTAVGIMSRKVEVVGPDDDLRRVARRMVEEHRTRLPVVDEGRLVGIVSRVDLLRLLHRTDAELERAVELALTDSIGVGAEVEVHVRDGVVRLRGAARAPVEVDRLAASVWQVPGVSDVRNEVAANAQNET